MDFDPATTIRGRRKEQAMNRAISCSIGEFFRRRESIYPMRGTRYREWTNQESWLLTPDSLETFLRWESESRVTIQDSRVRSQLKSPSENLENFEHFLLIYLVNEALKCWKWSSYSKRYLNMVKVVNKAKDELEKLPHFTVSYGIKIGSDRESWLELESSNLGQGRESESEYWNKVTSPFPSRPMWNLQNCVAEFCLTIGDLSLS